MDVCESRLIEFDRFLHLERAGVVHSGPFQAIPAHSELISGPFQQSLHSEPIVMGQSSSIPAVPDSFRRIPAYSLPSVPIPAHSVPIRPSRPSSVSQICEQNLSKNLSRNLSKHLSKNLSKNLSKIGDPKSKITKGILPPGRV